MLKHSPTQSRHGVMVCIDGQGVLITGKPGIGKSSLALALVADGHQLVADDVIEISQSEYSLFGHCPSMLKGLLHTRELGTLDIEALFGNEAIVESAPLQYLVELHDDKTDSRLEGSEQQLDIMQIPLPLLKLSVLNTAPAVTRLLTWLKMQQHHDANQTLKRRQQAEMQQ